MDDSNDAYSAFLNLPVELRCQIYGYLLADPEAITIGAGYTTIFGNRTQDRRRKTEIPGLPLDLTPLVRYNQDSSLLSVAEPPTVPIDDGWTGDIESEKMVYPAPMALLLTCRLVNDEMTDYQRGQKKIAQARQETEGLTPEYVESLDTGGLSLYVTYPYGVLVLKHMYPYLLKQAKRVHISGHYTAWHDAEPEPALPASFSERLTPSTSFVAAESFGTPTPARRSNRPGALKRSAPPTTTTQPNTRPRLRLDPPSSRTERHITTITSSYPPFTHPTSSLAPTALAHLVRTLLPSTTTRLKKLTAHILYPGDNSYTSVWSDDNSPICHILRSICGGEINMQVVRGGLATGVRLTACPRPESRIVSTSWQNWRREEMGRPLQGLVRGSRRDSRGSLNAGDLDRFLTVV